MVKMKRFRGVLAPVITPFNANLGLDVEHLLGHCRWLLTQHVGLAVFGTNSEGNSLSTDEKIDVLDQLIDQGIDPSRMMPGTGSCALTDAVRLSAHAVRRGCRGVLVLPPFYYKSVSDEGLYRYYARIIEQVGSHALQIYLYHIPAVSQTPIHLALIEQLLKQYPENIAGIKDSSGSWDNTSALLQQGWNDFHVFTGSELFLLQNMRSGGVGCISATANINPAAIHQLYAQWKSSGAEALQQQVNEIRTLVQAFPMIPALKTIVAHAAKDSAWERLRPPLVELNTRQKGRLLDQLQQKAFTMSGLRAVQTGRSADR